jgi:hypothetical protein
MPVNGTGTAVTCLLYIDGCELLSGSSMLPLGINLCYHAAPSLWHVTQSPQDYSPLQWLVRLELAARLYLRAASALSPDVSATGTGHLPILRLAYILPSAHRLLRCCRCWGGVLRCRRCWGALLCGGCASPVACTGGNAHKDRAHVIVFSDHAVVKWFPSVLCDRQSVLNAWHHRAHTACRRHDCFAAAQLIGESAAPAARMHTTGWADNAQDAPLLGCGCPPACDTHPDSVVPPDCLVCGSDTGGHQVASQQVPICYRLPFTCHAQACETHGRPLLHICPCRMRSIPVCWLGPSVPSSSSPMLGVWVSPAVPGASLGLLACVLPGKKQSVGRVVKGHAQLSDGFVHRSRQLTSCTPRSHRIRLADPVLTRHWCSGPCPVIVKPHQSAGRCKASKGSLQAN